MRSRHRLWAAMLVALIATAPAVPPARAKTAVASREERSLLAAEDARFAALVRHDVAAVAAGLAEELIYSHGNGRRQTRNEYLKALRDGALDYRAIEPSERTARIYGKVGVTRAVLATLVGSRPMRSSVLALYVWRDRRWQLFSWQTTPIPDPVAAPGQ